MKIYRWKGRGHYYLATIICVAECMEEAREIIKNKLIENRLAKSWENSQEIEETDEIDYRLVYIDDGDF